MNELQQEVCELVSKKLGSRGLDGRVVEALGNIEDEAGLRKLREVVSEEKEVKPWYKRWWMLGLCCLLLLIGGWFVKSLTYDPKAAYMSSNSNKMFGLLAGISMRGDPYELSDKEKWLLSGDTFHPINENSPYDFENSDAFVKQHAADHVFRYEQANDVFPNDLLEIGASVDPDNPWYLYMRVSDLAQETVLKKSKLERERKAEGKRERDRRIAKAGNVDEPAFVVDESYRQKLSEAWDLLENADGMGRLRQHRVDLAQKKLIVLSNVREHDYLSRIAFIAEWAGFSSSGMAYLKIEKVFVAKFEQLSLSESGDKEQVKKWLGIYKRYLNSILDDRSTMVDVLVIKTHLKGVIPAAQKAAENVGLDDEAQKMENLSKQLAEDKVKISTLIGQRHAEYQQEEYGILSGLVGSTQMSLKPLNLTLRTMFRTDILITQC